MIDPMVNPAFTAAPLTPTLPLQIAEQIASGIVDEQFAPGERLKEVVLSQTFGVSRATIREALRILENRHLVSIVPQRGAQVTNLSRKELEDMFEIRAVLLGLASRRVALECTPKIEARLRAGIAALEKGRGDSRAYAQASANLSLEITRLSGNEQLVEHIAMFAQRIGRYARMGLSTQARRDESLANWKQLLRAIVARKADLADVIHQRLSYRNRAAALEELERRGRNTERMSATPREERPPLQNRPRVK
jgi:DNA-binding GntR family transcriptional regulator